MKGVAVHYTSFMNPVSQNVCITRITPRSRTLQTLINRCQELLGGSQKENLMQKSRNRALVSSPFSHQSVSSPPSWAAWFSSRRPTAFARWAVSRRLGGRIISRALSPLSLSQCPAPGLDGVPEAQPQTLPGCGMQGGVPGTPLAKGSHFQPRGAPLSS